MIDENKDGRAALRRIAIAFFLTNFEQFLLHTSPEHIAVMCKLADVDEAGFIAACKVMMSMGPADRAQTMMQ